MALTRRKLLAGLAALLPAAAFAPSLMGRSVSSLAARTLVKKPNIIFLLADDMRFDATSYAGNPMIKTPNLDKLADTSFVFDNSFVTTSICPTSRASIYSSEYALVHGVTDFDRTLRASSYKKAFFKHIRAAGYHTGFIGKWGIGLPMPKRDFDVWNGFSGQGTYYSKDHEGHLTDHQTKQTIDFLENRPKDKPFMLMVAYKAPHGPLNPQKHLRELYEGAQADSDLLEQMGNADEAVMQLPPILQNDFKGKLIDNVPNIDRLKRYYQLIVGMDESLGEIMANLSAQGLMDDTSIIFSSDNGMMLGAHGFWGKWYMFEESIRVPLLIRPAPNYFPNLHHSHVKAMALNIDIGPTMMAMAGVPMPSGIQGASLMPLLENPDNKLRDGFFYEFYGMPDIHPCIGYRTDEWKFVRYYDFKDKEIYNDCLYDLKADPGEKHNLIGKAKYKEKAAEMLALMHQEQERLKTGNA
jgi:arylsulfatase A-like enzyme